MSRLPAIPASDLPRKRPESVEQAVAALSPRGDQLVTACRVLAARPAQFAPFPAQIDGRLHRIFAARGIRELYTHQADAVAQVLAGRNIVITTPTASGKTLCYNLPILDAVVREPSSRALYIFPTKALAQDQLAELHDIADRLKEEADALDVGVFTYDGDTPQDARRSIRGRAHLVLTNPDMLHSGILPHHPRWAKLFENLRFVVIDELHAYRGVFGSHLANVLRRLQRICAHYGSHPQFICSSATIANPRELAERLTEQPYEVVSESGAPQGEKFFLFVNPPVVNRQLGIRRSYVSQTRQVAMEFLNRDLQVIVFAQSRLTTEILTRYLKESYGDSMLVRPKPGVGSEGPREGGAWRGTGVPAIQENAAIRGYRGGYLPLRRREIERGLREGAVRAVVSTNALELGIDIGALDAAILAGYPGTIAATWQRAGRAGRRSSRSAAVLVASSAPLDQFIVRHPSYFFDSSPEHALINPDNLHILLDHIKCAAFELPFGSGDRFGGEPLQDILRILEEEGLVHFTAEEGESGIWHWTSESYPADAVSLRSVSSDNFVVVDTTNNAPRIIGETDYISAPSTLHPKAIYIVEGQLYQVDRFDFDGRKAFVRETDADYYTDAITYTRVSILDEFRDSGLGARDSSVHAHGEVHVVSRVVGFKKIKFHTNENVGSGELDLPEQQMHTTSYWLTIPAPVLSSLPYGGDDRRDGVVGLAFAMRQVAQLLLMCDGHDVGISIGGEESTPQQIGSEPRIFVYDNYPGGIGFSRPLFEMSDDVLRHARDLIAQCPCESGCPSCVGPIGHTGPLAKTVALKILELLHAAIPA